ncbi:sodium:solute symporter [Rhodocaloribacter litoris]|uniref:sodium:solute symporter n=1 Tax=Rhodocaloribacter litoris TaxID=2558931 RepID=UPI00141FD9D2|nr:sodium:solute symporter [Rhodocaloribacter litoris]QXD16599.1 sodium:solute symporter [Rhodocaloribacter litoris]
MPVFELTWIDLLMVLLYVVFIVWVGFYVARKTETTDDYFLAGRSLVWWLIGFSLFASNVSSSTLVGLSSSAFSSGIAVYNYEWMAALVLIFFVVFFLPFYLKTQVYTMPEFLERRYDARSRYYFSALLIFMNIVIDTAAALYAGALVVQIIYPAIPLWQSVVVLGVLAGLYTVAGGLKAVVYTDAVQAVLLIFGACLVSFLAFEQVGSWDAVTAVVPEADLSVVLPADHPVMPWPGLVTGVFLLGFYFWGTNQFMVQRTLGAKDLNHGRWGALFAGLLKLPIIFIMVLPGIFARLIYTPEARPEIAARLAENADLLFPTLMFDLLPVGIRGLVITALIAAIMSSVDSTLNSASTLVTMDFVKKLRPDASNHTLVVVGRVVTFTFMTLAILWAPQILRFQDLWTYLQQMLAYLAPPVLACFLVGVFWKRANRHSAFAGLIVGHLAAAAIFALALMDKLIVQTGPLGPQEATLAAAGVPVLHFLYLAPLLLVISAVTMVIVSLTGEEPDPQVVRELTWSPAFFREESKELAHLPWYKNYRYQVVGMLGLIALFVGMFW